MKKKLIVISFVIIILTIAIGVVVLNGTKENLVDNSNDSEVQEDFTQNDDSSNNKDNENSNGKNEVNNMNEFVSKINININGTNYTATLEDNETTREFVKRLPLDISMSELNGNEKYYYFSDSLPSNSSRIGKINTGDLMIYGSDCLVLFYETFNTSYSYTRLGKVDDPSSLKDIVGRENVKISFTK